MKNKIIVFLKQEIVLIIAVLLATVSAFIVKPDTRYIEYIDFRSLCILFCLMCVIEGMKEVGVFKCVAEKLLKKCRSKTQLMLVLVFLCFFSSMIITNDVALITFVPFAITTIKMADYDDDKERLMIVIIVMQTIAANLGSMMTPLGNPQNIYLFGISEMTIFEFMKIQMPYAVTALFLLVLWIYLYSNKMKTEYTVAKTREETKIKWEKFCVYILLFFLSMLTVLRMVSFELVTIIVILVMLIIDGKILRRVDYSLLVTFVGFFIFIGNMGRIDLINEFLQNIVAGNEVLISVCSSQIISNVPAALLLSGFTENYKALIVGINIGGLGTLIASMASLISFKLFSRESAKKGRYIMTFTAASVIFLIPLMGMALVLI